MSNIINQPENSEEKKFGEPKQVCDGCLLGQWGGPLSSCCQQRRRLHVHARTERPWWPQRQEGRCPCSGWSLLLPDLQFSTRFQCGVKQGPWRAVDLTQTLLIAAPVGLALGTRFMMQEVYVSDIKYIISGIYTWKWTLLVLKLWTSIFSLLFWQLHVFHFKTMKTSSFSHLAHTLAFPPGSQGVCCCPRLQTGLVLAGGN